MKKRGEIRSITDTIKETAYRKHRAAKARFGRKSSQAEPPRDVYLAACAKIASALSPLGYKYAKSGPHARRRVGDFTFQISFQSSHHNVSGEYVALWMHANVLSNRLKKWREQQAHILQPTNYVAGGQIGNLIRDHAWLEWDLADPKHREEMIFDAVHTIEQIVIPYFNQFENLDELVNKLETESIPLMGIGNVVEFLLCFAAGTESALRAGRSFLAHHPEFVNEYQQTLDKYNRDGLPQWPRSGWAKELAFASTAYDLPFLE